MDDFAQLAATVTAFAAGNGLTIVPAAPEHDFGPEVCLGPGELDLPAFLSLAGKLGGGVLYLRAVPFGSVGGDAQPEDLPAHLAQHKGQIGQVSVAFAANGLVHFWEHQAAWYLEWEETAASQSTRWDFDLEDDAERARAEEERARMVGELAATILADPRFRAATRGDRQRLARLALPKDTDGLAGYDAVHEACDRAQEMAQAQYDQITGRLDELAAELLAAPEYQQASSAAARKQAAERFLIPRADGFCPPPLVRDELYARAQKLAKTARSSTGGLF